MGGGAWQKNLPPGTRIEEGTVWSYTDAAGTVHYRGLDPYGNEWHYSENPRTGAHLEYLDEDGLRHTVSRNGNEWWDTWTGEDGTEHFRHRDGFGNWYGFNKEPGQDFWVPDSMPPWLELSDHHTYKDENGVEHYVYTDQHGNKWDWSGDNSRQGWELGYTDRNGQWHQVDRYYPNSKSWDETTWDENGNAHRERITEEEMDTKAAVDAAVEAARHNADFPFGRNEVEEGQPLAGEEPPAGEEDQPPAGDAAGGITAPGVPYQDYIPFIPMVQDPATGEWRNMTPEEIEKTQSADPGSPQELSNLFDAAAPGPTLDPALFDPNAPGPTLAPALFDPASPGPTIDAALLDPTSPGPTLDPNLLDPSAPGETIDSALLDPAAPGPTLDPAEIERGVVEPGSEVAEPVGVAQPDFSDSSLSGLPPPDQHTPDREFEDHQPLA